MVAILKTFGKIGDKIFSYHSSNCYHSTPWWQGGTVSQLFLNSFKIFLNFLKTLTIASRWGSVWAVYVFVNDDVFWCTSLYFELLLNDHRYSWPLIWFPTNLVLMLDSYGKSRISWMLTPPTARVRSRLPWPTIGMRQYSGTDFVLKTDNLAGKWWTQTVF